MTSMTPAQVTQYVTDVLGGTEVLPHIMQETHLYTYEILYYKMPNARTLAVYFLSHPYTIGQEKAKISDDVSNAVIATIDFVNNQIDINQLNRLVISAEFQ